MADMERATAVGMLEKRGDLAKVVCGCRVGRLGYKSLLIVRIIKLLASFRLSKGGGNVLAP